MTRRSARDLPLPKNEVDLLRSLKRKELLTRVHLLYNKGWTLQAIGNAFDPPRRRSTVKAWVDKKDTIHPINVPIPDPTHKTPKNGYQRITPVSPGVPDDVADVLKNLAPLARLYRARMPSTSRESQANEEMDRIVKDLRSNNVSIADIARAADVTHRAIARRLNK
jgi:hypothetical protein